MGNLYRRPDNLKISKIYNSINYWFGVGSRKGKSKKSIEKKCTYIKMEGRVGKANSNLYQYWDKIKKLTNKERLERIRNKEDD